MKIKYSFEQWCLDNNRHDLLDLWDYKLNNKLPSEVNFGSEDGYWFKCPRGLHQSLFRTICGVRNSSTIFCPECNTFGQWLIDNLGSDAITKYWSDKNDCSPFDIPRNGTLHIWAKHIDDRYPDYSISIRNFIKQRGIPKYNRKIVVKGVNDVATTHPYHAQYFLNQNDTYIYSYGNAAYVDVICPICGHVKNVRIDRFTRLPFSCNVCGDNVSYPNKFVNEFLRQLSQNSNMLFSSEKIFDWSKNLDGENSRRAYDFYIFKPEHMIIEAHGAQHYDSSFCSIQGARTLEEEKNNDVFKYNLAIKNGFLEKNYVVLNCSKSNKEWIKKSIMDSVLPEKLNFVASDIDWDKCDRIATSSYVVAAANLWNSGLRNTKLIATEMSINQFTVQKYLNKAHDIGLCDYDANLVSQTANQRPVFCKENNLMFCSSKMCESVSRDVFGTYINANKIRYSARENKTTCGLHFVYITKQEFIDYKKLYPNMTFGDVYLTI